MLLGELRIRCQTSLCGNELFLEVFLLFCFIMYKIRGSVRSGLRRHTGIMLSAEPLLRELGAGGHYGRLQLVQRGKQPMGLNVRKLVPPLHSFPKSYLRKYNCIFTKS